MKMPPRSRGRQARFTYEITASEIDAEALTISVSMLSHSERQTFDLSDFASRTIAAQLFDPIAKRAQVRDSWQTVNDAVVSARRSAKRLVEAGITDLFDNALTASRATEFVGPKLSPFFLEAIADRSDYAAFAEALSVPLGESEGATGYSDDEIEGFKTAATGWINEIEEKQREVIEGLDFDTSDRRWWAIPADEIIEKARKRDLLRPTSDQVTNVATPDPEWDDEHLADWLLLNPGEWTHSRIAVFHLRYARLETRRTLIAAIYPDAAGMCAVGLLLMLAGNGGKNPSTWLGWGTDSITRLGDNFGVVRSAKARSRKRWIDGVNYESKHGSTGGILSLTAALTRFTRAHHTTELAVAHKTDPTINTGLGNLFFVPKSEGIPRTLYDNNNLYEGFARLVDGQRLSFRRVRLWCVGQQTKRSPKGDVSGHNRDTRDHTYLPRALDPDRLASMAADAREAMPVAAPGVLSDCEVGHQLADGSPCTLGIAACFTCPSGVRTTEHGPALTVVDEVTQVVLSQPTEEVDLLRDVVALRDLAKQQLKQFAPPPTPPSDTERRRLRTVIGSLLTASERTPS